MKGADTGELGRLDCSWARSHASWAMREAKGRQADWAGGWESAQNSNQIRKNPFLFTNLLRFSNSFYSNSNLNFEHF
jgi:hypothetical protein